MYRILLIFFLVDLLSAPVVLLFSLISASSSLGGRGCFSFYPDRFSARRVSENPIIKIVTNSNSALKQFHFVKITRFHFWFEHCGERWPLFCCNPGRPQ
jgi:hypothetical protein